VRAPETDDRKEVPAPETTKTAAKEEK
jgi:hypothetical protein